MLWRETARDSLDCRIVRCPRTQEARLGPEPRSPRVFLPSTLRPLALAGAGDGSHTASSGSAPAPQSWLPPDSAFPAGRSRGDGLSQQPAPSDSAEPQMLSLSWLPARLWGGCPGALPNPGLGARYYMGLSRVRRGSGLTFPPTGEESQPRRKAPRPWPTSSREVLGSGCWKRGFWLWDDGP